MATKPETAPPAEAPIPPVSFSEAMGAAIRAALTLDPRQASRDGRSFLTLPGDFRLVELPDDDRLPSYAKGAVELDDRESLIRYVNRFQTPATMLLADYDSLSIHALLDYHPGNESLTDDDDPGAFAWIDHGPCRHTATLRLRPSEEFARWDEMEGTLHPQEEFARFLEENAVDVIDPESAALVELSRDFEATVGQVYKSSTRLDNGDRRLVFETETKAASGVVIPQRFVLAIPLYQGEDPDQLEALFRWRAAGDGSVRLGFQWRRVEYRRQAHFAAIASAVSEATGRPVMLGRKAA